MTEPKVGMRYGHFEKSKQAVTIYEKSDSSTTIRGKKTTNYFPKYKEGVSVKENIYHKGGLRMFKDFSISTGGLTWSGTSLYNAVAGTYNDSFSEIRGEKTYAVDKNGDGIVQQNEIFNIEG